MLYKALISFSGVVSMTIGEVREFSDQSVIDDLVEAGYIMPMYEKTPKETKTKINTSKK